MKLIGPDATRLGMIRDRLLKSQPICFTDAQFLLQLFDDASLETRNQDVEIHGLKVERDRLRFLVQRMGNSIERLWHALVRARTTLKRERAFYRLSA
jgi:hypothetical protein